MSDTLNNLAQDIVNNIKQQFISAEYVIELGIFSGNTSRQDETISIGITNAELMFIHENGSPLRGIPKRPVLDITLNWAKDNIIPQTLAKCSDGIAKHSWTNEQVEKELNIMALRIQQYARDVIRYSDSNNLLAPNSPDVAKRKKGNHPLFDTGQLSRIIRCKVIRIK